MHTLNDFGRRVDISNLIPKAPNAPIRCSSVDGLNNIGVQVSALGKCAVQGHQTNLGTHGRLR